MIELDKIVPNSKVGCDGRCEVRLLQTLQKAIGDILSDHARSRDGSSPSYLQAPILGNGPGLELPVEQSMRPTNVNRLQTEQQATSPTGAGGRAGPNASAPVPQRAEVATMVVDTIAEITRYPREILTPEARFDDDLGIDSLKRAEIVTALLNRFGQAPSDLKPAGPMPVTVGEMTDYAFAHFSSPAGAPAPSRPVVGDGPVLAAADSVGGNPPSSLQPTAVGNGPEHEPPVQQSMRPTNVNDVQTNPGAAARAPSNTGVRMPARAEVAAMVVDTIAEITRYPREILTPEARFDDDLGIDSLKRAEIVTALLNRFGKISGDLKAVGPMPVTVGEMTDYAVAYFGSSAGGPASSGLPGSDGDAPVGATTSKVPSDVRLASLLNATSPRSRPDSPGSRQNAADRPFEGRVALFAASSEGLGKVIAKQMAELGAHVIINSSLSRKSGEEAAIEILAANGHATHVWGSLASTDEAERVFREIEERFDRLDYYVHNTADEVLTSLDKVTEGDWEKAFRTNIVGYHLAAMRAAKLMKKSGGGRIVALSSPGAHRYREYYGVIGPVKAALESLTMYLAQELDPYNVQVNAVAACPIYGEQLKSLPDSVIPDSEGRTGSWCPGNPEEISDAVIFLLTRAARKINGATLVVDGGWSRRI